VAFNLVLDPEKEGGGDVEDVVGRRAVASYERLFLHYVSL
jgi:hypothetical protein